MSSEDQAEGWASEVKPLEECVAMGDAFFACLDGSKQLLNDDNRGFLKNVFHPVLSDRRQEGDLFVPPSARHSYVHKLRALVKEEETIRTKRQQVFLSEDFEINAPGAMFPHSWTPSIEISDAMKAAHIDMKPCPEKKEQAAALLEYAVPVFDKTTEDGTRFRIYNSGSLEVRTVQMFNGPETVGAAFSGAVA
jgi:hypothetical protein